MILPRQVRSGLTPNTCCAPPGAARNPEITSSKISSAPSRSQIVAQALQESVARRHEPHVAGDRLDERPRRSAPRCASNSALRPSRDRCSARAACRAATAAGTPGLVGTPSVMRARAGLHQERVGVAVIAALELDDLVALGRRPRDAHRAHRRLGARADEAHALHRRHQRRDPLRRAASRARSARRSSCRRAPRRRAP